MRLAITVLAVLIILASGCQAPCVFCKSPEAVVQSMDGQIANLRVIEKDLVDKLEDEEVKALWKNRLAAFIAESRGTAAWAKKDDFNLAQALIEERKD